MGEMPHNATDMPVGHWIDTRVPVSLRPYFKLARIDRPQGWWPLLLPCWWSTALASDGWPDPWFMALFWVGAVVMRGAGCVVNDIADRDFDRRVARTATRPITSGAISVPQALVLLCLLGLGGLAVLVQFNLFTVWLAIASLPLVAVYPLMKRITYWPQIVLGLTFNWGALVGWSAVRGTLDAPALLFYAAGLFWTLGYDTIYAHQDKEDDILVGVKSTALYLKDRTRPFLFAVYAATIALMGAAMVLSHTAWPGLVGLAAAAAHLFWQARTTDFDHPADCLRKFKSNRDFGLILLAGIVAARVLG